MGNQSNYRMPFYISLLCHVAVLTILVMSVEFNSRNFVIENSEKDILQAVIVDSSKIQMANPTPVAPPKVAEPIKKITPPPPPAKPPVKAQEKMQEEAPKPQKAPEPKVQAQKDTIAIPDPRKKKKEKELIEKQLLADLKKETDKQKKLKQKALEKAFEKELKAQAAKSLQQQLMKEQQRLASGQESKMRGIVDKYKALITQSIAQHWLVPTGVDKSLSSQLLIKVAPGGVVLDVQLVKGSGDDALDRSARTAVFKASPLPVPTDSEEFEPFRQFILKVKPENVLARDNGGLS